MAHIHAGRNGLAEKLNETRERSNKNRLDYKKGDQTELNILLAVLAGSVAIFLLLLFRPQIGLTVRHYVGHYIIKAAEAILDYTPADDGLSIWDYGFLEAIWKVGLYILLFIPRIALGAAVYALGITLPSVVRVFMYFIPLALAIFAACAIFFEGLLDGSSFKIKSDEEEILLSGLEGEQRALDLLSGLDDECHIFTNLHIPYEDGESETDMIVVTPAGVTIVEVKNHKGIISGDASDESLNQSKPRRRGGYDEKTFHNPIKQVGTHAYRLAGYLRNQGIRTYVRTCVLFVNDVVVISLSDSQGVLEGKCPVFTRETLSQLEDYLTNGNSKLVQPYRQRTVDLLEDLRLADMD